jgi:hypothetical protein
MGDRRATVSFLHLDLQNGFIVLVPNWTVLTLDFFVANVYVGAHAVPVVSAAECCKKVCTAAMVIWCCLQHMKHL